jgi:hypothetical protein
MLLFGWICSTRDAVYATYGRRSDGQDSHFDKGLLWPAARFLERFLVGQERDS